MMVLVVALVVWVLIRGNGGAGMFAIIGVAIFILAVNAVIFHYSGKREDGP
jgi:hypothetical protein